MSGFNKKTIIIIAITAIFVLILVLLYVISGEKYENGEIKWLTFPFHSSVNNHESGKNEAIKEQNNEVLPKEDEKENKDYTFKVFLEAFQETIQPFKDIPDVLYDDSSAGTSSEIITNDNNSEILPNVKPPNVSDGNHAASFTEEEIFKMMWPDDIIANLEREQNDYVRIGAFRESDRVVLNSQENIIAFYNKSLDHHVKRANLDMATEQKLRKSLNETYPAILEKKKKELIAANSNATKKEKSKYSFLNFFGSFIDAVNAQGSIWQTMQYCYKNLSPVGGAGSTGWSYCCNCGEFCSEGCTYMYDCGIMSTECTIYSGCLNSTCMGRQNAIWDNFGTMICGCG